MMAMLRWMVIFAILLPVSSLFEDQVGVNDFILKNIGQVSSAVYHPDAQKKRVFVTTEAGAIAALDVKMGGIAWRQMLPKGERADLIRLFGNQVATLSGESGHLNLWDAQSGSLLWDRMVKGSTTEQSSTGIDAAFVIDQDGDNIDDVAVLCNNEVALFSGDDGSEIWRAQVAKENIKLSSLATDGQNIVTVVGTSPTGSDAQISKLSAKDGSVLSGSGPVSKPSGAARNFCEEHVVVSGSCLACLSFNFLSLFDLSSGAASGVDVSVLTNSAISSGHLRFQQSGSESSVAMISSASKKAIVAELVKEGSKWTAQMRHMLNFQENDSLGVGKDKNGQELWAHARAVEIAGDGWGQPEGQLVVDMLSTSEGAKTSHYEIPTYSRKANGQVDLVFLNPYVRKDGSSGFRALITTDSHTACMVQQDVVLWENQGALAETVAASFVDIPVLPPLHDEMFQTGQSNPLMAIFKRFATDLSDLLQLPMSLTKMVQSKGKERTKLSWDSEGVSLHHDMEGDRFGFKKLAVVLTKPGVVFGIHTQTGAVVWKLNLADTFAPRVQGLKLFITRPTSSPGGFGNLDAVILGTNIITGNGLTFWINPLTGFCTGRHDMPQKVIHASLLPIMMSDHTKLLMMVMEDLEVRIVPDLADAHALLANRMRSIFFYITSNNALQGYSVTGQPREPNEQYDEDGNLIAFKSEPGSANFKNLQDAGVYEFKAVEAWSVAFPLGEDIVAMAPHSPEESVKAAGRVLGNRGVLLKYMNVNLLAVATQADAGSATSRSKESSVRIYLIDTVVGAIVHNVLHKDANGPVGIVQTENVVLYSFWHARKQHTEIAVLELFENKQQEIRGAAQIMRYNETSQSSTNMEKPSVISQAYILMGGIKTMAVTNTMHGITTRNFLLGLSTDQVLSLDKKFVDPRRPTTKPTPEDTEEGLIPYTPFLPIIPTSFLSYNHTVYNLRGISVSPARIESTCHMLAFGTDIFYSRVTPSKAYDCLGDDFNYATLLVSVIGLGLGTQVVAHFMQKRELAQAWK